MWVAKDDTSQKHKRFTRAVLSKYGNMVAPSIYIVSNRSILNSLKDELLWCDKRGVDVQVKFFKCGEYNFLIGLD